MSQPRTALCHSLAFTGHDTGGHPENPSRIRAIDRELHDRELLTGRPEIAWESATDEMVTRVHDPGYLASLRQITRAGGGMLDPDTIVRPDSLEVALSAAGAAVAAVDAVLDGRVTRAFVLSRPPGHHALPGRGMGFCLLNNVAIAAAHARARGVERVAIVDWDVHHGNGTEAAFLDDPAVFYASTHQAPFYPFTGFASERGRAAGMGATLNIPLEAGSGDAALLRAMTGQIAPALEEFGPELIFVSAGYDAHRNDPLAMLEATDEGFRILTQAVIDLADDLCDGRLIFVLEGGYDPPALARCVADAIELLDMAE
jgi:acetoin utilization deacetylase AcuC-like enzyme